MAWRAQALARVFSNCVHLTALAFLVSFVGCGGILDGRSMEELEHVDGTESVEDDGCSESPEGNPSDRFFTPEKSDSDEEHVCRC